MKKLTIGFFADGQWSHQLFEKLIKNKKIIIKFICSRYKSSDNLIGTLARKKNLPLYRFKNVNSNLASKTLSKYSCDLFVSMSYDQIFEKHIISIPLKGIINCHAGKLPDYKGRNVLNWAIINGEKYYGITTHFINEKIDEGNIILQKQYKILCSDDYNKILNKSYVRCSNLMYLTIKKFLHNDIFSYPQKNIKSRKRYFKKRKAKDEKIDWSKNIKDIYNLIRGISPPAPGAKSNLSKKTIRFYRAKILNNYQTRIQYQNGAIIEVKKNHFLVNCKNGVLKILDWDYKNNIVKGKILK